MRCEICGKKVPRLYKEAHYDFHGLIRCKFEFRSKIDNKVVYRGYWVNMMGEFFR